jgi:protein SCO1/2
MKFKFLMYTGICAVLMVLFWALVNFYTNEQKQLKIPYYTSRVNQNGNTINQNRIHSKITVIEFFFTTCKSICPVMNKHLKEVYQQLSDTSIHFLSFTVDPERDTPEQLQGYAKQLGVNESRWDFVTGSKSQLYALARHCFELDSNVVDNEHEDFIHTQQIVVLDRQGFVRGYFDGTNASAMDSLKQCVIQLLKL